jgi:hypothetical protein
MNATAQALIQLARKYRALAELRQQRDRRGDGEPASDSAAAGALRQRLRVLAQEFPGCLRELDTLGEPELARRAQVAELAGASEATGVGASDEPWMAWICAYHALMRAALHIRAGDSARDPTTTAQAASAHAGITVDTTFVAAVERPPQGRLGIVVLRLIAAHFDVPAHDVAATLFPPRRPRPYQL